MRLMVTGGGTGGHTSPAVAIIEELLKRDPRLSLQWVGCRDSVEERVCRNLGLPFRAIPSVGWPRGRTPKKAWAAAKIGAGCLKSFGLIQQFQPQLVLGVGGYVSVPLMWAAQRRHVPTILHEQNKRLGMANELLAKRATRVLLSYPDTEGEFPRERARVVGNPVRAGFSTPPTREGACAKLRLDPKIPVVLVCGGSQGATSLNRAMADALPTFAAGEAQFLWMTGAKGLAEARSAARDATARVEVFGFIDDMVTACAASDLLVSRAGASSTAEIAMLGKASVLVPYPFATDQHQDANARAFAETGAAVVITDEALSGEAFAGAVRGLLGDQPRLLAMGESARQLARPVAVEEIVEEIFSLVTA